MKHYTVNVKGNVVSEAKAAGYYAYYADGITAIEIKATNKKIARSIASNFGSVEFIFE